MADPRLPAYDIKEFIQEKWVAELLIEMIWQTKYS